MKRLIALALILFISSMVRAETFSSVMEFEKFLKQLFPSLINQAEQTTQNMKALEKNWVKETDAVNVAAKNLENAKAASPEISTLKNLYNQKVTKEKSIKKLLDKQPMSKVTKATKEDIDKHIKSLNSIHKQVRSIAHDIVQDETLDKANKAFIIAFNNLKMQKERNSQYKDLHNKLLSIVTTLREKIKRADKKTQKQLAQLEQNVRKNFISTNVVASGSFVIKYADTWIMEWFFPTPKAPVIPQKGK